MRRLLPATILAFACGIAASYLIPQTERETEAETEASGKRAPKSGKAPASPKQSDQKPVITADLFNAASLLTAADAQLGFDLNRSERLRFMAWSERDPARAFAAALDHPELKFELCEIVLEVVAAKDRKEAVQLLMSIPEDEKDLAKEGINNLFTPWIEENLEEAAEAYAQLPQAMKNVEYDIREAIFRAWPEKDLASGFLWYLRNPGAAAKKQEAHLAFLDHAMSSALERLEAVKIPANWLASTSDPEEKAIIARTFLSFGFRQNAMELIGALPETERAQRTIEFSAIQFFRSDGSLETMVDLLAGIDPLVHREQLEAAAEKFGRNPFADSGLPDIETFSRLPLAFQRESAGNLWQYADLDSSTADWIQSIREPEARSHALKRFTESWIVTGGQETSDWINALPPGPDRDSATAGAVRATAPDSISTGLAWARQISEPVLRDQSTRLVFRHYLEMDPELAQDFIRSSDLSTEAQQLLLSRRPQP